MANEFNQYFSRLLNFLRETEVEQKRRYDDAIDIDDISEATAVTIDARTKIQQLRKWIEDLQRINLEIERSFLFTPSFAQNKDIVPSSDTISTNQDVGEDLSSSQNIGDYVRQKMYTLCKSGFIFTDKQLRDMQDSRWSRDVLNLPHPFVRIYDDSKDLLEQTSINGVPRRYWVKDKFQFGNVTLLVYNGWAPLYKPFFDAWYDSLAERPCLKNEEISLIVEKDELKIEHHNNMNINQDFEQQSFDPEVDINTNVDQNDISAIDSFTEITTEVVEESLPTLIERVFLLGKQYNKISWQELLVRVCETIVLKNPYKIATMGASDSTKNGNNYTLTLDGKQKEPCQKLSNGFYVYMGGSNNEIRTRCEHILSACGFSINELQIL